ncbi:MAG: CehA/McbA family metallohydrolase [Sandaracinaceae bacterium]|nr:CehA/McbA family metallohydrolase [Sandaracinaceae bacterium]
MPLLPQSPERYLRAPRLTHAPEGATLHVIAWENGAEHVLRVSLDAAGDVLSEQPGDPQAAVVALSPEAPRPADSSTALCVACDAASGARVRVTYEGGLSRVVLETAGHGAAGDAAETPESRAPNPMDSVVVFEAACMVAAPAVLSGPAGTLVAFHHDLREDTHETDVAKWIALRLVTPEGDVLEPAAPMTGRDRDLAEVEQSFEFPALALGPHGAVALFGRGSHNFWRQDLDADGFHPRVPLSDGEWGSRGRWVSVVGCESPLGPRLVTAQRDRRGILVQSLEPPQGQAPTWVPTAVRPQVVPRAHVARAAKHDPAAAHGMRTYFGDIQQHSAHSDGVGSADEVYLRARHRYDDDFVALTDHESFLGKRTGPGEWAYLQDVADRFDEPGAFATLIAYEWTGKMYPGPGHKCVYLPRRGLPLVSRDDLPEGADLVRAVRELGGIASPHHIGWTGCDEAGHDPEGQPVWEICSCHGCYEHADHPLGMRGEHVHQLADVMLKKGLRFGFTASSDSHGLLYHHGEARKRDPYRTGLTAVQAPSLTRDAVFEALRARRCYGTSGAKILLDMRVDGAPMGSVLKRRGPVPVSAKAHGESDVARLELITRDGVVATAEGRGRDATLEAQVDADYVYARVVQRDGEMAWASPVFMEH